MNKEEKFLQAALFRYSLIAPAVAGTFEAPTIAQYFRNIAGMKHLCPDGRHVDVTFHSLERWYYAYKKHGLAGITPKARVDAGKPRALPYEAIGRIHELRDKFPYITGKAIYNKLIVEGAIDAARTSLATVQRYIKNSGLKAAGGTLAVRAFEMEHANDCWQADSSRGPVIKVNGRKCQTFLIAFIDDSNRKIAAAQSAVFREAKNCERAG